MSPQAPTAPSPSPPGGPSTGSRFRHFFLRGLAVLLPTILTIWILIAAYSFVQNRIADPINRGVKELVIRFSPLLVPGPGDYDDTLEHLSSSQLQAWQQRDEQLQAQLGPRYTTERRLEARRQWMRQQPAIHRLARRLVLERWWNTTRFGGWAVMDLVGLVIAIMLIYMVGLVVGSFIGGRLVARGEDLLRKVPLIRQVYPSVKQVTDFLVGDQQAKLQFNRVVAVEYPRKGLWSVGLVTGQTMQSIQARAGQEALTVFIPSSPTPFTGYVITVPKEETLDLGVSIEDALRFTISGGVIIPPSQVIETAPGAPAGDPSGPDPSPDSKTRS